MTTDRRQGLTAFSHLADDLGRTYRVTAQDVDGYRVTDPGDVEFVSTDWDGSEAEASYPNPTADDTDLDFLADHYLFVPQNMDADDPPPKSAFKAPMRMGPGGPVNTNALLAIIQAINGARGGFDDVDESTLSQGFDTAVDLLVDAGFYDSEDDAPDKEIEAGRLTAEYQFGIGDTATWAEDSDNQAYGIIRDRTQDGEDNFADEIDGDFALDATEDNPAYLLEILDERDDGWVPTGTMVGHRQETLSSWTPDGDVMEADRTVVSAEGQATVSVDITATTAQAADGGSLTGIIWGAGDHDLALGGEPTPVRVPQETIRPTFEALKEDVQAEDVTLGFDHPDPDSVAAKTGIVDIGLARGVALSDDGQHIVLTDSDLTNDRAVEAAEAGDFDSLDWSVVADVAVRRDQDGDIVQEDGRVVLDATRIRRIDAVDTGAVDAASIERGTDPLPDLKDEAQMVQQAASDPNQTNQAVQALKASATAISEHMNDHDFDPNVDADIPDDIQDQLDAAADVIDRQSDELKTAQAKASAFQSLLSAHGVDQDDFEDPQAAAQAVIDDQTEQTRQDIAELEADLGKYDTDDVDARAEELAGNDPDDLQQMLNARKADAFDRQQKRQQKGRAAAKGDAAGRVQPVGGSDDGGDADADDIALGAMDGSDRINAEANGQSPAEYVRDQYGVNPSQYDAADELHAEIMDAIGGDS